MTLPATARCYATNSATYYLITPRRSVHESGWIGKRDHAKNARGWSLFRFDGIETGLWIPDLTDF
jgi:hypothetical protein